MALLFATLFAALSNADYIVQMWKGKLDTMGSPLAHVGFALTIFGAVLSTAQKDVISQNRIGDISTLNEELNNATDLLLMEGDTLPMGPYFVSYRGASTGRHSRAVRHGLLRACPQSLQPKDTLWRTKAWCGKPWTTTGQPHLRRGRRDPLEFPPLPSGIPNVSAPRDG